MTEAQFRDWYTEVYAAQGKAITATTPKVMVFAFRKIGHLPTAFFEWAAAELEDYPGLPDKLWLELQRVLFPRWLAATGKGRRESCCADCDTATPGFFTAWKHDGNGFFCRFVCKCACNHSKTLKGVSAMTRAEAERNGYIVMAQGYSNPFDFETRALYGPASLARNDQTAKMINAAMAANNEAGEDHAAYMEEMEAEEYA